MTNLSYMIKFIRIHHRVRKKSFNICVWTKQPQAFWLSGICRIHPQVYHYFCNACQLLCISKKNYIGQIFCRTVNGKLIEFIDERNPDQ